MRRPDARWGHAARVALAATAVVGAVTLVLALVVNAVLLSRLDRDVDGRVAAVLAAAAAAPTGSAVTGGGGVNGDVDDAPVFVWRVGPRGAITALTVGSPPLPAGPWAAGTTSRSTQGRAFRFTAVPSGGGLLVAGESAAKVGEAGGDLVLVELVLGTLLLLVTFTGSFVVGLRASAPIEQIRRRQAEFTADASHELRTPLSVIEAEVELALGRPRDPMEYEEALRRIGSESGRLRAIVEDLLWLARADAPDTNRGHPEVVDLSATVAATAARFTAVADAGTLTLSAHTTPPGTARVRADAEGLDRLVTVLLDNACKYAGDGGAVAVTVATVAGRVVLTVDDSGPGIPEEHRGLVFDRFHRVDHTPGGTGLGLAIADAVVHASSGTWTIGSSPLGGARFEVAWRAASRDADDPAPSDGPRPTPPAAPAPAEPGASLGAG